jgi:hypothetical protein
MLDLFLDFIRNVRRKFVHIVISLHTDEFCQCIDQISGLFDLGEAAATGQAFFAIIATVRFAFTGIECAHTGFPSLSNTSIVTSPSMSVISAMLSLPFS